MSDRNLKPFLVPSESLEKSGTMSSWLPLNDIILFPNKNDTETQQSPSFIINNNVVLFHPILRKLVNESSGIFTLVQSIVTNKSSDLKEELLKHSMQYRSTIRACLENLQDEISTNNKIDSKETENMKNYITIFYSVECIWHLCEILFIDVIPGNIILPYLLDWVRFHFPKHERNAAILLADSESALEIYENYWPTIFGNLLQGRIKVVRALLKQNSASETPVFKLVDQLLKAMPSYNIVSIISINEFSLQWRQWIMDVQLKIDAKQFIINYNLDLLMRLLVGEEEAWFEIQTHCEVWYEYLAGWLFCTEPTVKTYELGPFARRSITNMRVRDRMKHLDRVLLAAMEFDLFAIIQEIQKMTENGWFATHLTDILYHCGGLSSLEKEVEAFSAEKLRESFILEYGTLLATHSSLWEVGLSYLDFCPNDGLNAIELILPRIPFSTEAQLEQLVREARSRELNHIAQTLCKIQAVRSMRWQRQGNALIWALKSQDTVFISNLSDKFLKAYIKDGELESSDLLDSLGSSMLASDRLIFLGKYNEFHRLYETGEYKECGKLLISLLSSKIVPNFFWKILLNEAIPLLENEDLIFNSNDTYTILLSLEQHKEQTEFKDEKNILRLAAARNLSRALMYEAQEELISVQ